MCAAANGALSGLSGMTEAPDLDTRSADWRSMGIMQLLKRASNSNPSSSAAYGVSSKRRNGTSSTNFSSSTYGIDLAISCLTTAGERWPPAPSLCPMH